jgi:hypothetical protein
LLFNRSYSSICDIPLVEIDISLLADQVGVATANTLDAGQGVHDLLFAIDVGVEETENELDYVKD